MRRIFFFVDAPQHHRIVAAMLEPLTVPCEVVVLYTTVAPPALCPPPSVALDVHYVASLEPSRGTRTVRTFLQGRARLLKVRDVMARQPRVDAGPTVVVFNDTGIVQRDLLRMGKQLGWHTVLVQDGLTETTYRESRWIFRIKRLITATLMAPLGLAHYGTSRYGESGAKTILADGPLAVCFFRGRAPDARVLDVGFLRPSLTEQGGTRQPYVLFWAVDFLGGLQDAGLHQAQLTAIASLSMALEEAGLAVRLRVRLHPRDMPWWSGYMERLGGLPQVELMDPVAHPDPFEGGAPLMTVSLQSAGVFDALAARVPSFFMLAQGRSLAPTWTPEAMRLEDQAAFIGRLIDLQGDPAASQRLWSLQVGAMRSRMTIPFDPPAVRGALLEECSVP